MVAERKRSRRKEARPREILDAALELFAEQGFAATKMSEIAERAGIAKGTIYRYFETKDALFEALVRSGVEPVLRQATTISLRSDMSSEEILRTMIETIYRSSAQWGERRTIMRLLIAEGTKFPHLVDIFYRNVLQTGEEFLGRIIQRGVANGEFRDGPACREPRVLVSPEIMATIWQAVFSSLSPIDEHKFMEAHIDLILHGILSPNRPGSPGSGPESAPGPASHADDPVSSA